MNDSVADKLADLGLRYAGKLPARIASLQEALAANDRQRLRDEAKNIFGPVDKDEETEKHDDGE